MSLLDTLTPKARAAGRHIVLPEGHDPRVVIAARKLTLEKTARVTVLASQGDRVAIRGIEPNQPVVISTFLGWTRLSAGQKVEVLQ